MTMRSLLILVAICFSATAFGQSAPPKVGSKPLVQVKPKAPIGCKLIGTVRGTKLWAGDCVVSELRGSTATTENQTLPEQATGLIRKSNITRPPTGQAFRLPQRGEGNGLYGERF